MDPEEQSTDNVANTDPPMVERKLQETHKMAAEMWLVMRWQRARRK